MQRAMQTAIHMFKNHPNLAKIRFIVVPLVHEIMHTCNDMHMDAYELIDKYSAGKEVCQGLNFDFSMILGSGAPNLWAVHTLTNNSTVLEFYTKLAEKGGEPTYENVRDVLVDQLVSRLPHDALEPKDDLYERGLHVKKFLKHFLEKHPVEGAERIAVVCHSQLIACLTATGVEGSGASSKLVGFHWAQNGEVYPIETEELY